MKREYKEEREEEGLDGSVMKRRSKGNRARFLLVAREMFIKEHLLSHVCQKYLSTVSLNIKNKV